MMISSNLFIACKLTFFLAKEKLYNDVISKMKESNACFPKSMTDDVIAKHVNQIVDVLWYIDGSSNKLASREILSVQSPSISTVFLWITFEVNFKILLLFL